MHPQIDFPELGDCPICGMDLILKPNSDGEELSGKIAANHNTSAMQAAHFGGGIERLYYKSKGEYINRGALLASIYSPDLVTTQNELLEALQVKELQPELYNAVRNKLKN